MGLNRSELVKFVVTDFVYDIFGGKCRIREKSPNMWEKSKFE
jgi:hypothetical protein